MYPDGVYDYAGQLNTELTIPAMVGEMSEYWHPSLHADALGSLSLPTYVEIKLSPTRSYHCKVVSLVRSSDLSEKQSARFVIDVEGYDMLTVVRLAYLEHKLAESIATPDQFINNGGYVPNGRIWLKIDKQGKMLYRYISDWSG